VRLTHERDSTTERSYGVRRTLVVR
jgi:hypothetical protein